jgi:hypothetical protein
VQGVAFRLGFDRERIGVEHFQVGPKWPADVVAKFAVQPNGELWAGVGHIGAKTIAAQSQLVVARVEITLRGNEPAVLSFLAPHCQVLTATNKPAETSWLGGVFQR